MIRLKKIASNGKTEEGQVESNTENNGEESKEGGNVEGEQEAEGAGSQHILKNLFLYGKTDPLN